MLAKKLIIISFGIITCSLVAMKQNQLKVVYSDSWMPAALVMIEFANSSNMPQDVVKNIFKQMHLSSLYESAERDHWVMQLSENVGIQTEDLEKMRVLVMLLPPQEKQAVSRICKSINICSKANCDFLTKETYEKEALKVSLWFRSKFGNKSEVVVKKITIQNESKLKQILSSVPEDLLLGGLVGGALHLIGANLGAFGEIMLHALGIRVTGKDFFSIDSQLLNPSMLFSIEIGGGVVCATNMIKNCYDMWENPPKPEEIATYTVCPLILPFEKELLLKECSKISTTNEIECILETKKEIVKTNKKKNMINKITLPLKKYKKDEQLFLKNRE